WRGGAGGFFRKPFFGWWGPPKTRGIPNVGDFASLLRGRRGGGEPRPEKILARGGTPQGWDRAGRSPRRGGARARGGASDVELVGCLRRNRRLERHLDPVRLDQDCVAAFQGTRPPSRQPVDAAVSRVDDRAIQAAILYKELTVCKRDGRVILRHLRIR